MRFFSFSILSVLLVAVFAQSPSLFRIDVYQFKGVLGEVHSKGLDTIEARLKANGHHVETRHHWQGKTALKAIIKSGAKSVSLVCHSAGCITAKRLAFVLETKGIKVCYLATMDPVGSPYVAANVDLAENWHQGIFPALLPSHEFAGQLVNNKLVGISHIEMDNQRHIHQRIATVLKFKCSARKYLS